MLAAGALVVQRYFPAHAEPHPRPEYLPEEVDVDGPDVAVVGATTS
jgi:hypothetical protein